MKMTCNRWLITGLLSFVGTWNRWLIIGLLCFAGYGFYRAVKAGDDPIEIVYLGAQSWYRDHEVHGYALFFETDEEIDVVRMKRAMRILLGDNLYVHESGQGD